MRIIRNFVAAIAMCALMCGLTTLTATPAIADDKTAATATEVQLHIVAEDYSLVSDSFEIKNETRLTVNGTEQVSWMQPDKADKPNRKSIKNAPIVRTTLKMTSKDLYKKSKRSKYVRIIGPWTNDGKYGDIVAGFPSKAKWPGEIMVRNDKTRIYEHGATLWADNEANRAKAKSEDREIYGTVTFGGKRFLIVETCWNDFHGKYDIWIPRVTQVKYENDVQKQADAEATSTSKVVATFGFTCPDGASFNVSAWAFGTATADAAISYTERTKLSVLGQYVYLKDQSYANANVNALTIAGAGIDVSAKCGTPVVVVPPVTGDIVCANPPHLYHPNGNGLVFCELVRSDGVKPQLANFSIEGLNDFAHFAQPTETSWRDDSTLNPCPANTLCVRIQVWADAVGLFKYLAKFSDLDQVSGSIDIKADEFIVETS